MKRSKGKPLVLKRTEGTLAGISKLLHRTRVFNLTRYIQRLIVNTLNILAQGRFFGPLTLFSKEIATPLSGTLKPLTGESAKVSRRLETIQPVGRSSISAEVLKIRQGVQRVGDMINLRTLLPSQEVTTKESIQKGAPAAQSLGIARNILRVQRSTAPLLYPSLVEKTEPSKIEETKEEEKPRVPIISEEVSRETRKESYPIPLQQTLQRINRLVSPILRPISIKERTLDREIRVTSEGTEMPLESPTFPTISPLPLKEPMEAKRVGEAERVIEEGNSIPIQQNVQSINRLVSPILRLISIRERIPVRNAKIPPKEIEMPIETPRIPEGKLETGTLELKHEEPVASPPGFYISPSHRNLEKIKSLVERTIKVGWGSPPKVDEKGESLRPLSKAEIAREPSAPSQISFTQRFEKTRIIPEKLSIIPSRQLTPLIQSIKSSLTRLVSSFLKPGEVNIPVDLRVFMEPVKEKKEPVSPAPIVNNTFNISIQAEDLEKEEDLRELADKICKILIDEGRRYGMNLT